MFCKMTKLLHYGSEFVVIGTLLTFALLSISRSMALFVGTENIRG